MSDNDSMPPDPMGVTPVYAKHLGQTHWPTDKVFFLVAGNGLFRCRNHEFFRSCTPYSGFPLEYDSQASFLHLRFPIIPRRLFELVVGFFGRIQELHNAEAIVLLAWNRKTCRYEILVPMQTAIISHSKSGRVIPESVVYEVPEVPAESTILISIHSHADHSAYSSAADAWDERHRAGVHIVVGRVDREPPEIHIEAVVDACRFRVAPGLMLGGYMKRRTQVPSKWFDRFEVRRSVQVPSQSGGGTSTPTSHEPRWRKTQGDEDHRYDSGERQSHTNWSDEEKTP